MLEGTLFWENAIDIADANSSSESAQCAFWAAAPYIGDDDL